jgi:hypothetical protein
MPSAPAIRRQHSTGSRRQRRYRPARELATQHKYGLFIDGAHTVAAR